MEVYSFPSAHSIPYQNDIQYFPLHHSELKELPGLTIKFKQAIWILKQWRSPPTGLNSLDPDPEINSG